MTEDLLPIDIQCNKLVDWLIDRRHCSLRWQKAAEVVKKKISTALLDMPNTEEMKKLLEGSCFHYFKCLKIVDVLKDTEKSSKNIFGMYSSQRMKDWKEIVKLYEAENLHLAELSNRLLRNINYEIPAVKKQIVKCAQFQEECQKKIEECKKSIQNVERGYASDCKKLGIAGKNVKRELLDLVVELPSDFDAIGKKCKDLLPIIEYYATFVEFSISSDKFCDSVSSLLRHVSKNGNTTVYQWKYGVLPDRVVKEETTVAANEEGSTESEEIDWGGIAAAEPTSDDVIDFDIDVSDAGIVLECGDGDDKDANDNEFELVADKDPEQWEIEEVSITEVPNGTKLAKEEKIAQGDEALRVLECVTTRTQFINELIELIGFLSRRLVESKRESDVLSMNQFQFAPPILQLTSTTELEAMLSQVTSIHESITTTKMLQLCRILDSPKYVDRIADKLKRQLALTKKYESTIGTHQNTIKSSQLEEASLRPKVAFLIEESKEWQKLIESEISKRYKNRPVYILGSINML